MKLSGITRRISEALASFLDRRGTAWGVGVVMPPLMLLLDPVVFRGTFDQALLGRYRTCCYLAIGIAVSALVAVLSGGKARAYLSGIMAAAAGFGFLLGVAILPFSLIGILVLGIGLLGLSPFLAALVDMDQFIGVWTEQSNPDAKRRLAEAYMAITGEDLEERAARAAD